MSLPSYSIYPAWNLNLQFGLGLIEWSHFPLAPTAFSFEKYTRGNIVDQIDGKGQIRDTVCMFLLRYRANMGEAVQVGLVGEKGGTGIAEPTQA